MTKVAVISADGRIAGNVIKELVARGYDVTVPSMRLNTG